MRSFSPGWSWYFWILAFDTSYLPTLSTSFFSILPFRKCFCYGRLINMSIPSYTIGRVQPEDLSALAKLESKLDTGAKYGNKLFDAYSPVIKPEEHFSSRLCSRLLDSKSRLFKATNTATNEIVAGICITLVDRDQDLLDARLAVPSSDWSHDLSTVALEPAKEFLQIPRPENYCRKPSPHGQTTVSTISLATS